MLDIIQTEVKKVFGDNAEIHGVVRKYASNSPDMTMMVWIDRGAKEDDHLLTHYGVVNNAFYWSSYDLSQERARDMFTEYAKGGNV